MVLRCPLFPMLYQISTQEGACSHYLSFFPAVLPKICKHSLQVAPELYPDKSLPHVPHDDDDDDGVASNVEYYEPTERSRVPLIHQQGYLPVEEPETPRLRTLSTIEEKTERTEASPRWPSRQQLISLNTPRPLSSSPTSSYGEVIGELCTLVTR